MLLVGGMIINCSDSQQMKYPETIQQDVTDRYFGHEVADPYRWLEDDNSDETAAWVDAQNAITNTFLATIPYRGDIRNRLESLVDYPRLSTPFKRGENYFFFKNDGLQNQSVLFVKAGLEGTPRVLLDPNTFSEDGTVALGTVSVSHDGNLLAYTIARSGSDWNEIRIKNIETGDLLADHLEWIKFSGISWEKNGFYYSRYDRPVEGDELSGSNEFHKVYYHKIGNPQSADQLVYETSAHPRRLNNLVVTRDEKFLSLYEAEGSTGNALWVKPAGKVAEWKPVTKTFEDEFRVVGNVGDRIFIYTNANAPRYRLIEVVWSDNKELQWNEVIPEADEVMDGVSLVGGKICASYMKDARSQIKIFSLSGEMETELVLPGLGTAEVLSGAFDDDEAFYRFESYTNPGMVFRYRVSENKSTLYQKTEVAFNTGNYITEQAFYTSKDGTKVPMFLIHKKGLKLEGHNPTMLYGYGGFNISLTPSFSPRMMLFLEQGGVYAIANLRGGGEYGEAWHAAGTKLQKQNVFDDCIAAAEYLIDHEYTNENMLALMGGSNGGLLVGAVVNQRPDLFRAALPQVGVMDMLRYHEFTIGWAWAGDYGTSGDSEEMFQYLFGYSPYHNIRSGVDYPSILALTADHDDRVVPAHTFKYMAMMQEKNTGGHPTLVRIETKAGHGAGKPVSKQIDEYADIWAFVFNELGVSPKF